MKKLSFITNLVLGGAIGLSTLISGCYSVPMDSVAVIKRFGGYARTESPGLHAKLPLGIEKRVLIPVQTIQTEEFGFRTIERDGKREYSTGSQFQNEYLMLTADLNIVDVESSVQFQIQDPVAYLFNVKDPRALLRSAHSSILREEIGNGSVDEALMINRQEYAARVKVKLQKVLDEYKTGIKVGNVNLQSSNPPENVRNAFNAVNEAMKTKETTINEARNAYNAEVPKALGTAQGLIAQAEGYALTKVNTAKGDVAEFSQQLSAYKSAPDVTAKRMYLTALQELTQKNNFTVVEQRGIESGLLIKLDLDQNENPVRGANK